MKASLEQIASRVWTRLSEDQRARVVQGGDADALRCGLMLVHKSVPHIKPTSTTLEDALVHCLRERDRPLDDNCLAEVFLACACIEGSQDALLELERRSFVDVERALRRLRIPDAAFDEVKQILRSRLFVSTDGGHPRVFSEAGRGDLRVLVRVAATRIGLNLLRKTQGHDSPSELGLDEEIANSDDPEILLLRDTYEPIFKRVLCDVMLALGSRERTLLRLHLVDELTVDEVGRIYTVHRATAARWIADAKRQVIDNVQRSLRAELRLENAELMSLFGHLHVDLDVTLSRLLASGR